MAFPITTHCRAAPDGLSNHYCLPQGVGRPFQSLLFSVYCTVPDGLSNHYCLPCSVKCPFQSLLIAARRRMTFPISIYGTPRWTAFPITTVYRAASDDLFYYYCLPHCTILPFQSLLFAVWGRTAFPSTNVCHAVPCSLYHLYWLLHAATWSY